MNIVEAYIEQNKQLVILLSGFSGSGKSLAGKSLVKDINTNNAKNKNSFTFINLNDFYKSEEEYKNVVEVGELKVVDWDDPSAIDWDEFNKKVDSLKATGVAISGFGFPQDKLKFKVDMHIHFKISKDDLLKNRADFSTEKLDDKTSRIGEIGAEMEKRILNKVTFQHYLNSLQTMLIHKTVSVQYGGIKLAYDEMFDYIMDYIKKKIR